MSDHRPIRPAVVKLKEIAKAITAHLRRFEADPVINASYGLLVQVTPYFQPSATPLGSRIAITYVSYQGGRYLTRREAEKYLAWLDAGNVGKHYKAIGRPHT